jgi:hypothetical protein
MQPTSARQCVRGHPLVGDSSFFCQGCGAFQLDQEGTVQLAGIGDRILAWFVNALIFIFTLFIGWVIWWFIVAPRGQNPGKAIVGIRVIGTDGRAVKTGGMFVRGLVGQAAGLVPFGSIIDNAWLLWDKDVQTLHDKVVNTVVVKGNGSEKIVELGALALPAGYAPPPAYAPPVQLPGSHSSAPHRQESEVFCSNCGQPVSRDAQYCPKCGARVAATQS